MKKILLTKGYSTIVDDDDYDFLMQWDWYYKNGGYAVRKPWCKITKSSPKTIMMHRVIIDAPLTMEVDHINVNGLDNRKSNLRLATRIQNQRNLKKRENCSSIYKGVWYSEYHKRWRAEIMTSAGKVRLGSFRKEKDAAIAYNLRAVQEFGEFYNGNIIL